MAPGVNRIGRQTGTVPKTKTHNNAGPDNALSQAQSRSNVPNNLITQDWQPVPAHNRNRTRKTSNTQASFLEFYDVSDAGTSHDSSRYDIVENHQELSGPINKHSGEINGREISSTLVGPRQDCVRRISQNVMPDKENKSNISKMPDRNQITGRLSQIRDYIEQTSSIMDTLKTSGKPNGAVWKMSDSSRCNELRLKLEESQKKLQAMQEHQAELQMLQQQTQEQLKEARAAQSSLMARTASAAATVAPSAGAALLSGTTDDDQNADILQGNLDNIRDRLYALHEMYENRNQLMEVQGDHDAELVSEHIILQDKLQELQSKKERMDHLVADFQPGANGHSAAGNFQASREKGSGESSKEGSEAAEENGDISDLESDVQQVRNKMAQLSAMRTQLRRLQNLVDSGMQDTESTVGLIRDLNNGLCAMAMPDEAEKADEEQAVNLRRQRQSRGRNSVSRTNSTSSSIIKPDNISQAGVGSLQESEISMERKAQKLKEAKLQLHHLQKLLSTVLDLRSRGEPVPDHYLRILEEETIRVDQEEDGVNETTHCMLMNSDREREEASTASLNDSISTNQTAQESSEVTLEMVQAMAQELRAQTHYLQEEKEKLVRARQELRNARDVPFREKKTNTQMLLQAKRRELEELMRKDQGQSSSVNQDICSELSAGKSETPGFSYMGEGTSAATWGGSTQGTLDDLGERDEDVQEQSGGCSSDEAQDDEDETDQQFVRSQIKCTPLNTACNAGNNNNATSNKKDILAQSTSTNRETLGLSLESGVFGGGVCGSVHSNAASGTGSYPAASSLAGLAQQRPGPRNMWRKSSTDSNATLPRAIWTPQQHVTTEEPVVNSGGSVVNTNVNHQENESISNNVTHINQSASGTTVHNNWWQQQAMQLQSQLEATNNLYQSLLLEQQQQQQQQQHHQPNLPCWPQPPALTHVPIFRTPFSSASNDTFYQQLLAATQFQQQQLLLTTINQCCHLLWMQQREMTTLRAAVLSLQDKMSHSSEGLTSNVVYNQPEDSNFLMTSSQNSVQPTPHQSHSNLSRNNSNSISVPGMQPFHPSLKVSYSGGLFQLPEELGGSAGVVSAHSLPNLTHPPVLGSAFSDTVSQQHMSTLNNSAAGCSNRYPNPQPLTQCSIPQAATHGAAGAPWLQQGSAGAASGLLTAHASSASPVPALNNQVPPGNRANNYWDNFRSYSRQNLLSASTKSNEGISHSPSPLIDRSHNTLRNSSGLAPQPPSASQPAYSLPEQGMQFSSLNLSRKEKLNIERFHTVSDNYTVTSEGVPEIAEFHCHPSLASSQYHNANTATELNQQSIRPLSATVPNNTVGGDLRGASSSWHCQPTTRTYGQRGANCKRKNPRLSLAMSTAEHGSRPMASSSSLASTPQERGTRKHWEAICHRSGSSLFDVLSESVYTEVAALIAVNETRPHFLIQLFRDLQMVSSDPLRQRTLQSIHELVSQYLAEASGSRENSRSHQNTKSCTVKGTMTNDSLASSDDEESSKIAAAGAATLPLEHNTPQNAGWSTTEDLPVSNILPGQNEWELEAVLEDLLPFLKNHLDEVCSPALLDSVRQQAVQLMLAQTQSHTRSPMIVGVHQQQPAGGYFQGQLDALLEDGLNKFQGCRLREVCEDLLLVITDILQSELTFLKLVDTVRREETGEATKMPPSPPSEEPANSMHALHLAVESAAQPFPTADISQNRLESLGSAEGGYNGDLAEADQSHHEEAVGGSSPQHGEEVAGAVIPEDSDDDGLLDIIQNDTTRQEEKQDCLMSITLAREEHEEQAKTEAEDEWIVEQDREQSLDRAPTHLTDEFDSMDRQAASSVNHTDTSTP